jgi:hypothetical protein
MCIERKEFLRTEVKNLQKNNQVLTEQLSDLIEALQYNSKKIENYQAILDNGCEKELQEGDSVVTSMGRKGIVKHVAFGHKNFCMVQLDTCEGLDSYESAALKHLYV